MSLPHDEQLDRLDQATAARLGRLRSMPVDTSVLTRRLQAALPRPVAPWRLVLARPLVKAVAAVLVIALLLGGFLSWSERPVLASLVELAQLHGQMQADSGHNQMMVTTLEAARKVLTEQSPSSPQLPHLGQCSVNCCCVRQVCGKKMSCAALSGPDNSAITLVVAAARQVRLPDGPTISRNGINYRLQSCQGLNMVMCEQSGRFLCLISPLPSDQLLELAGQMK